VYNVSLDAGLPLPADRPSGLTVFFRGVKLVPITDSKALYIVAFSCVQSDTGR
jgi:hypothetical protein